MVDATGLLGGLPWNIIIADFGWTMLAAAVGGLFVALLASVAILDWNRRRVGLFWAWFASMILCAFIYVIYVILSYYVFGG